MLLALLPVSFVLLRFGEPYGLTDLVGVIIVGGLWFLLPRVLKPWIVVRDNAFRPHELHFLPVERGDDATAR